MTRDFIPGSLSARCISARKRSFVQLIILLFVAAQVVFALEPMQSNAQLANSAQESQEVRQLEVGKSIERELAGGQSHIYQITLSVNQFLNMKVEQKGIDVAVVLFGPDGKQLIEMDSPNGDQGPEPLMLVASVTGPYRIEVRSLEKPARPGRYEVIVDAWRNATEQDRDLAEAFGLHYESMRLKDANIYDQAIRLAERAQMLREKQLGSEHAEVADTLSNLADLYRAKADFAKAELLQQRVLSIRENLFGPEHLEVADALNDLAMLIYDRGDYAQAEQLFLRSFAIKEKKLLAGNPDLATTLNNLAVVYRDMGDYGKARQTFERVIAIKEAALGLRHKSIAISLDNFAQVAQAEGDYTQAEALYQRALTMRKELLPPDDPDIAESCHNLAGVYSLKGDQTKAEPLFQQALTSYEKAYGSEHPFVAVVLGSIGDMYKRRGDYAKAESFYQRALAIKEKKADNPISVAMSLNDLAGLAVNNGDYAKANDLYQRALTTVEKGLGPKHPDFATLLYNFAWLCHVQGKNEQAESLTQRALTIFETALGADHPRVAFTLANLAMTREAQGNIQDTIALLTRSTKISERNINRNLIAGAERQKLAYLRTLTEEFHQTVSFHNHSAPQNAAARNLALTLTLQRKGRILDAMTDSFATLRRHASPSNQALLDQWKKANGWLAKLALEGPQQNALARYRNQISKLEEEVEQLEAEISRRSDAFHKQAQPVTLKDVQDIIPANAALIEFVTYRTFNINYIKPNEAFGSERYAAYVLQQQGEAQWVNLGDAQGIHQSIDALRQAFKKVDKFGKPILPETQVKRLARALDGKIMAPVRKLLGQTRQLLISPDGQLNLVPFAALVDEGNHYLASRYMINYLSSGRDLLRLGVTQEKNSQSMILGSPAYGEHDPSASDYFRPLLTGAEVEAIQPELPGALIFKNKDATEAVLKQAHAPQVLHIATHGFFLPTAEPSTPISPRSFNLRGWPMTETNIGNSNPLLRSGLALAGANQRHSGDDDGILTALEVAGLDLWGTKLVVLSACDTGLGEVKDGEGVYGLRRALVLAGAESQVVSLWKVNDAATRDLMVAYYKELKQGVGRAEALRRVQQQLLRNPGRRHPYYWASFIHSGEWANLNGQR